MCSDIKALQKTLSNTGTGGTGGNRMFAPGEKRERKLHGWNVFPLLPRAINPKEL
jgi:hypothetical protein